MKKLLAAIAISAPALLASAQDINKEIVLDKEIVPELRAATRLPIQPQVLAPQVTLRNLSLASQGTDVSIPSYLSVLSPASTLPAITVSDYKGYIQAGYFPKFNVDVSAGYHILSDSVNQLNVWAQYNGNSFKRHDTYSDDQVTTDDERTPTLNIGRFGVVFSHKFASDKSLAIEAGVMFGGSELKVVSKEVGLEEIFSTGGALHGTWKNSVGGFNASALWKSGSDTRNYYLGVSADYFSSTEKSDFIIGREQGKYYYSGKYGFDEWSGYDSDLGGITNNKNASDGLYNLNLGFNRDGISVDAKIGLRSIAKFKNYSDGYFGNFDNVPESGIFSNNLSKTLFNIEVVPGYTYRSSNTLARIGLKLNYLSSLGKSFSVAPDVNLAIAPSNIFSVSLDVTGGREMNFAGKLFDYNPFIAANTLHNTSDVPLNARINLVFGPFKGAAVQLHAAYAIANDWLMPTALSTGNIYLPVDMKGWQAGASVTYNYAEILSAKVAIAFSPQAHQRGWFEWRDRAKQVIDIDFTAHPICNLNVNAGFQLRQGRAQSALMKNSELSGDLPMLTLGDAQDLHLGASWNFTSAFSVFANIHNLLNKKSLLVSDVPMQGITGLIGASIQF